MMTYRVLAYHVVYCNTRITTACVAGYLFTLDVLSKVVRQPAIAGTCEQHTHRGADTDHTARADDPYACELNSEPTLSVCMRVFLKCLCLLSAHEFICKKPTHTTTWKRNTRRTHVADNKRRLRHLIAS